MISQVHSDCAFAEGSSSGTFPVNLNYVGNVQHEVFAETVALKTAGTVSNLDTISWNTEPKTYMKKVVSEELAMIEVFSDTSDVVKEFSKLGLPAKQALLTQVPRQAEVLFHSPRQVSQLA